MAGAGSATVAWTDESSFLGGPTGTPTYYEFGRNVTVDDAQIANNLTLIRSPDDPETEKGLAENFEGSWAIAFVLKNNSFHDLLFNNDSDASGTNDSYTTGTMPSAEIYLGLDHVSGTTERVLKGAVVRSAQLQYQQGQPVRVTLRGLFGDESYNTSITPGSTSDSGEAIPFHGAELKLASSKEDKLQQATLDIAPNTRYERDDTRHPAAAVIGNVETRLQAQPIVDDQDNLERALGSSGSTSVQSSVSGVSSTLTFTDSGGSTVAEYSGTASTVDEYNWSDLVNPETDVTEPTTYVINGVSATD